MIEVDFATMSLAFKNLIDNGRKYGTGLTIAVHGDRIEFRSHGSALPRPLAAYTEPFSRGDGESKEGFGLGLYIVHAIVRKHKMELTYKYDDGVDIFAIGWS